MARGKTKESIQFFSCSKKFNHHHYHLSSSLSSQSSSSLQSSLDTSPRISTEDVKSVKVFLSAWLTASFSPYKWDSQVYSSPCGIITGKKATDVFFFKKTNENKITLTILNLSLLTSEEMANVTIALAVSE
jgi:hypothetical protein